MKEISLFTLASSVDATVEELGKMGVVEIREVKKTNGEEFEWTQNTLVDVDIAINLLKDHLSKTKRKPEKFLSDSYDPKRVTDRIIKSIDVKKKCLESVEYYQTQLEWYKIWGDKVDIHDFEHLEENGVFVKLYRLDESQQKLLKDKDGLVQFSKAENVIPVALFSRDENEKLPFKKDFIPPLSYKENKRQLQRKNRQLLRVDVFLTDMLIYISVLEDYKLYLQDLLNKKKALAGMGNIEGQVSYLKGFIPHNVSDLIQEKAKQNNWGYEIKDPENPEEVPVYIKNPSWINIINPVMKFIDIVPGYKEVDVSVYFLVAFSLFFAMLVGDAGYGAIFLLAAFLFRKKFTPQMRILIYVLSGATMVWGMLSGTYFGSETIAGLPFFKQLIIPDIASFGVDNISFMMHLSFLIGAIHLTIAHTIRVFQFINSVKALSEAGWIALMWGLFFVAENLVLGKAIPHWNQWLFIAGVTLVVFFSKEGKTLLGSMMSSVANLPLSLINGFSDIVSYVRLFAVGMATATVASSFNHMILPDGADMSFLGLIMAVIALLLGHGLNIVLALMAVMVHGIRLNMLEFSGHLGVQFSGEAYNPFVLKSNGIGKNKN